MIINRENRAFDYCESFDVAVIGGGISGVMAAAAASKTGARTLLVENSTFLGSVVTMGPLEALMTQYDARRQVIRGLAQEFFDDLAKLDSRAKNTDDAMGYCRSILPYDAEKMKLALAKFLSKYQVTTLLETALESVQMTADGRISGVTLRTRVGAVSVSCRAVVDSTGSGYCAYLAGNDLMVGDDETGQCQPVTVLARFGGVDTAALRQYVREHPKDFKTFRKALNPDVEYLHLWGFSGALKEGYRTGALDLQRDEIHMMETTVPGEVVINYSRMNIDPFDPFAMSEAQRIGTEQVVQIHDWFQKTIPAFKDSLIRQSGYVGIRESGRIKGRRVLTREDVVSGRDDGTGVAMGAFPIDIHQPGNGMKFERILSGYSIPADCLRAEKVENLFAAGRCISATFEANASCRIAVTCMATGHAAGVMAAVYSRNPAACSAEAVRKILLKQNAILS